MREIPEEQVILHLQTQNAWGEAANDKANPYSAMRRRPYFDLFFPLIKDTSVRRAILLMGPRRVGKTVLLHQVMQELVRTGVPPRQICYLSVDHPLYNGRSLAELVNLFKQASRADLQSSQAFIFFDEIQYLKDWEVHLKTLVDNHPNIKFIASGSAAAALRLKSSESGAGRFTDFMLPPLTFYEYLQLLGKESLVDLTQGGEVYRFGHPTDLDALNASFLHYLNFGGYPEVLFSTTIQSDPSRYIKSDIIDKVLLRDLPGLYGIQDIQELNYLFTSLAFNTANEVSLEELSQNSGVAKNTIKKYIEYLEAAFLIKIVHRIDRSAKRFMRANFFKIYLMNPSMRSALFSPVQSDDTSMGHLAETGIFSQWFHSRDTSLLHYARWDGGEVDIVYLGMNQKPAWAVEVKWSDSAVKNSSELKSLLSFCRAHEMSEVTVTTRSEYCEKRVGDILIHYVPTAVYCYTVGHNLIRSKKILPELPSLAAQPHSPNETQRLRQP